MEDTLTATQRKRLAKALEARRGELRQDVRAQLDGTEDDRIVGLRHRLEENDDWGVADGLAAVDIAEVRHALAELTAVDAALARMRDGSYGTCPECGEAIAAARLMAYPTAMRCLDCQEAHERRGRGSAATAH